MVFLSLQPLFIMSKDIWLNKL